MKLSVIVLNYKVPYFLQLCLESVTRALVNIDSEIIVVDNNSQDSSIFMLNENFPEIKLIANTQNVGFAKGNNQGVANAKGEYICILNPDVVIPENCFTKIFEYIEGISNLGALGTRLIDGTGNYLPESKRNFPTLKVSLKKLLGDNATYYANQLAQDENGPVPVLVGALMFLKRSVYVDLQGFDEDYFMYGEDIDLSYRLTQQGYSNHYLGSVKALHFKGESSLKDKVYARRFYGAMQIFNRKHHKSNAAANWLIQTTLKLMILTHKTPQSKKKLIPLNSVKFWVTDTINSADDSLFLSEKELKTISLEKLNASRVTDSLIVYDLNDLNIEAILDSICLLKNNQNRFRIRPSNCNFIAGSDSSLELGEIISW